MHCHLRSPVQPVALQALITRPIMHHAYEISSKSHIHCSLIQQDFLRPISAGDFWPRDVLKCGICYDKKYTSVCPSLPRVTPKWFNTSQCTSNRTIEGCFEFSDAKFHNHLIKGFIQNK